MVKRLTIQIFPDGMIRAESAGIKGKKCTGYIRIMEEMLEAEAVESRYTPEYYESDGAQQGEADVMHVVDGVDS
ncbi:MAG: DUF2997 domain-containing protein [Chloroflexota bacterium]